MSVAVEGGNVGACCHNIAPARSPAVLHCGRKAASWRLAWDVTRQMVYVSPTCGLHAPRAPTAAQIRKWASHDVSERVARALVR